jgi:hypothetical protein
MISFVSRTSDGFSKGNMVTKNSIPKGNIFQIDQPSPILQDESSAIVSEPKIIFHVANLLRFCRPAAICSLIVCFAFVAFTAGVISESVNAVQGMFFTGARSHIVNKGLAGCFPSLTDIDATTTIKMVIGVSLSVASGKHFGPNLSFGRIGKSIGSRFSMMMAHATMINITNEVVCSDNSFVSTFATTQPPSTLPSIFNAVNCRQCSELFVTQILSKNRNLGMIEISHDVSFPNKRKIVVRAAGGCNDPFAVRILTCA